MVYYVRRCLILNFDGKQQMKKSIKLLLMILFGVAVICLAGAAIYGKNLSYQEMKTVLFIPKAIFVGIGIKMLYDAWKN